MAGAAREICGVPFEANTLRSNQEVRRLAPYTPGVRFAARQVCVRFLSHVSRVQRSERFRFARDFRRLVLMVTPGGDDCLRESV